MTCIGMYIQMDNNEFECLLGVDNRTGTYEEANEFGYSNKQLLTKDVLTKEITTWMTKRAKPLTNKDIKFIKYQKSLKHVTELTFAICQN